MDFIDLLEAVIKLGLPLAGLSWFIFNWLYSSGELDRGDNRRAIAARIKKMKKSFDKDKSTKSDKHNANFFYEKWMKFSGGFYGLAGLWTLAVIEFLDAVSFIFNFPGVSELLADGIVSFVYSVLANQLGNIFSAFIWFTYWPAESTLVWVLIAYVGYWTGVEMARRNLELPVEQMREQLTEKGQMVKQRVKEKIAEKLDEKSK